MYSEYNQYNEGENDNWNYGRINLDEIKVDSEQEKNIITKYNLLENNFNAEFEEQVPFYY